jgi:hypothetical protein
MAEVDIGSLNIMTLDGNIEEFGRPPILASAAIELYWGPDIAPGQWFQAALHIMPGQLGTSAGITGQFAMMDNNGATGLGVQLTNFSQNFQNGVTPPLEVSINVLSAPAHGLWGGGHEGSSVVRRPRSRDFHVNSRDRSGTRSGNAASRRFPATAGTAFGGAW